MATAVLQAVPTTITLAESVANWTGDTFVLDPDILIQGSNSVSCSLTTNGVNQVQYSLLTPVNLNDEHLRLWFNISFIANLAATDKIQVGITDGSNTAFWTWDGGDEYAGGWSQAVIWTGATPTSGTKPTGNTTQVIMRFNCSSKPRNVPANAWFDAWYYGDGYQVTGGTSGDEISWSEIAALDKVQAYGIVTRLDDIYFLGGSIVIGAGGTPCWFKSAQKAQFRQLQVDPNLFRITFQGTGCNVNITGGAIGAAGTNNYVFDADDSSLNSFMLDGIQMTKASTAFFKAGQTIQNNVFTGCGIINPTTSIFSNNTISNSVDTVSGALSYPTDDSNLSDCSFINNPLGVWYGQTADSTSPTFRNLSFTDVAGQFDVNNQSLAPVTIIISGGGNANSFTGSTVTFSNPKSFHFTLSPSIINYEWRLYSVTALGSLAGSVELAGEELASVGEQTYNYNYSSDTPVALQIISKANDYIEQVNYFTLLNESQNVVINLTKDNNN